MVVKNDNENSLSDFASC